MELEHPHPASGFDGVIGLEITEASEDLVRGTVPVRDELKQRAGLVHGGVCASIAESLASAGTSLAVLPECRRAVGLSSQTNFLRPITRGAIHAVATRKHTGRTTWVWEIEIFDDDRRLCVVTRMTVAVGDLPDPEASRAPSAP